jgi:hypothetical protein
MLVNIREHGAWVICVIVFWSWLLKGDQVFFLSVFMPKEAVSFRPISVEIVRSECSRKRS